MNRTPVASSKLLSIGYDPSGQVLEVEFRDGCVFQYYHVPPTIFSELMSAPSKGYYFEVNVSARRHPYRLVR